MESNKARIDELKQPGDPEDDQDGEVEENLFDAKPEEPAAGGRAQGVTHQFRRAALPDGAPDFFPVSRAPLPGRLTE